MTALLSLLKNKNVSFDILEHPQPIRSAQDGADYFGIAIGQTAPTLVLQTDNGYVAAILSGDRGRLDFQTVAALLGCKEVKLAPPKKVEEITGFRIGTVPLVGLCLPCLFDRGLFRYPSVYGGTGDACSTLKISPVEVEALNQVVAYLEHPQNS
ncbi:aminoacyl-tRNA deacylase [Brevibacillus nitrificans]|uniref:aminoacyl-tRNA deacylase n=1 Tax=Brevibacillus nitrificans TaxID=651560 RepID=UPI0026155C9D|nr:YbaK/EbsC family protein [Brevibacillus nitrificans]MED1793411.1 YbaK/EbsC family protein [Brevibacillus nitrificans]